METLTRLSRARGAVAERLGRESTPEELARRVRVPAQKARRRLKVPGKTVSLETPISDSNEVELGDLLEDAHATPPDSPLLGREMVSQVGQALAVLSEHERRVLRLRFEIGTDREHTLDEIGEYLALSRQRIRRIAQALRKLRRPLRGRDLKALIEAR